MTLTEHPVRRRSTSRRMTLAAALVALALGVVVAHQLWWSAPTAFHDGNYGTFRPKLQVGETFSIDMSTTDHAEDVWLHSAEPVMVEDSSDATVDFVVCHHKSDTVVMGAIVGSMDRYCSSVLPLEGYQLRADRYLDESIYMRVTPRKAGVVHVDGFTVNYSRGWGHLRQTGSQQLRPAVLMSDVKK